MTLSPAKFKSLLEVVKKARPKKIETKLGDFSTKDLPKILRMEDPNDDHKNVFEILISRNAAHVLQYLLNRFTDSKYTLSTQIKFFTDLWADKKYITFFKKNTIKNYYVLQALRKMRDIAKNSALPESKPLQMPKSLHSILQTGNTDEAKQRLSEYTDIDDFLQILKSYPSLTSSTADSIFKRIIKKNCHEIMEYVFKRLIESKNNTKLLKSLFKDEEDLLSFAYSSSLTRTLSFLIEMYEMIGKQSPVMADAKKLVVSIEKSDDPHYKCVTAKKNLFLRGNQEDIINYLKKLNSFPGFISSLTKIFKRLYNFDHLIERELVEVFDYISQRIDEEKDHKVKILGLKELCANKDYIAKAKGKFGNKDKLKALPLLVKISDLINIKSKFLLWAKEKLNLPLEQAGSPPTESSCSSSSDVSNPVVVPSEPETSNSPLLPTLSPLNLRDVDNGDGLLELLLPPSFSAPFITPSFKNFTDSVQKIDNTNKSSFGLRIK